LEEITVNTINHTQFLNIDDRIQSLITKSEVRNGVCHIFVPHTTAGITINENADPAVTSDMEIILNRIVPWKAGYSHVEGNSAAHVKASMMGFNETVFIQNGRLAFGMWQSIYFCEFDGPRTRKIWVTTTSA